MTNTQWKEQLEKQYEDTKNNLLRLEGALQLVSELIKEEPPVKKAAAKKVQTKETTNE